MLGQVRLLAGVPRSAAQRVDRSGDPADFVTGAVGVEGNDPSEPVAGTLFANLVRAGNACCEGPAGQPERCRFLWHTISPSAHLETRNS